MKTSSLLRHSAALTAIALMMSSGTSSASTLKISLAPNSSPLSATQTATVTGQLDAPIICPPPSTTTTTTAPVSCNVVVDFSVNVPAGISLSQNVLTWNFNEWSQSRSLVATLIDASQFTSGQVVTISGVVTSSAEYYANFVPSFTLVVAGTKTTTTTTTTTPPTTTSTSPVTTTTMRTSNLPQTGSSTDAEILLGTAVAALGVVALRRSQRQHRRSTP